jgi:NADH-quinone oxidoreductase subunit J
MVEQLFYFLSFLALLSALMVVFSKNPVHSVLYLILAFFAIAGHYIFLNAQFLAVVHIIVYAGAIMVLFLFTIMLLNLNKETEPHKSKWVKFAGAIGAGSLLLVFVAAIKEAGKDTVLTVRDSSIGMVENLGKVLFNDYVLPFEIASILLLAAMVGAILLANKEQESTN